MKELTPPRLGAHMSIDGGLHLALERGHSIGCETIQLFTRNNVRWKANPRTEEELKDRWDMIWPNTDILIVHGPPALIHDETDDGTHTGSVTLGQRIREIKPGLVVCGHIHEARGLYTDKNRKLHIVNVGPSKDGYCAVINLGSPDDVRSDPIKNIRIQLFYYLV